MVGRVKPPLISRRPLHGRALPVAASRYSILAQSVIDDIGAGHYPVGSMLPTEAELCAQFGVSRHTVREALRKLREMGMVSRHQGIGTRVKAKSGSSRYVQSIDSISDLFTFIKDTRLSVLSRRDIAAGPRDSATLRCPPGQRWRVVEVLRHAKGKPQPMVASEIFIPHAYAAIGAEMEDLRVPIYTLIEKHYGHRIVEVQQEVKACAIPAARARLLKVPAGSPGLLITRHYLGDDDRMLLVSRSLYPADRFSYSMSLRLSWRDAEAKAA